MSLTQRVWEEPRCEISGQTGIRKWTFGTIAGNGKEKGDPASPADEKLRAERFADASGKPSDTRGIETKRWARNELPGRKGAGYSKSKGRFQVRSGAQGANHASHPSQRGRQKHERALKKKMKRESEKREEKPKTV